MYCFSCQTKYYFLQKIQYYYWPFLASAYCWSVTGNSFFWLTWKTYAYLLSALFFRFNFCKTNVCLFLVITYITLEPPKSTCCITMCSLKRGNLFHHTFDEICFCRLEIKFVMTFVHIGCVLWKVLLVNMFK